MKSLLFISLLTCSLLLPYNAHAGAAGGGATEVTQLLNNAQLVPMNISDAITAVSTKGTFIKGMILDPIANSLISSALEGASNDILSWVSGGFGGSDPLIIANPESYITNQGLKSVKGILGGIPSDSLYGNSIFNSLLSQYKGSGDLKGTIESLSKSDLPGIIQNNLCKDEKLAALAKDAIENSDGTYDMAELTAKKTELWNYACAGSADDPVIAARLTDLSSQNESIGGWDEWLAITSGNNEYTSSVKIENLVEKKLDEKAQLNISEIFGGAGPVSEKECVEYAEISEEGQEPECLEYITVTPGDQVGGTLTEALTAGTKRLQNIMGDGSLTGMLQGFAISAITSGIRSALNSSGGSGQYNVPVTLPSSRPIVQDLANDPLKKSSNLSPMNKQLSYYLTTLNNLATLDNKYLSELTAYESKVARIKDCSQASFIYNNRIGRITPTKNSLKSELNKIAEARAFVDETQTKLNASNSSQEQGTIFNAYLAQVEDRGYPTAQTEGSRQAEYIKDKFDVEHDNDLDSWINTCAMSQQQQQPTGSSESPGNN
jgi:hypothetical protein